MRLNQLKKLHSIGRKMRIVKSDEVSAQQKPILSKQLLVAQD